MSFEPPQVGRAVLMLLKVAGENGITLPVELAMIGKTLLNLDKIGHVLAPHFDPNAAIRRHAANITREQLGRDLSIGSLFSTAVELKNFVQQEGMQKVANRIALGLVLAALIVGAALLMDVPTSFQLFGYPGLAMLLFLGAAAGGTALAISILANDIKAKRKTSRG